MRFRYGLALLVALSVFLVATAPAWLMARVASSSSSGRLQLEQPEGSFWKGRAAFLTYTFPDGSQRRLEGLSWDVLASRLLRGQIAAHLKLMDSHAKVDAVVGLAGNGLFISDLQASVQVETIRAFVPAVEVWKPTGMAHINAGKIALEPLQIVEPATIQWTGANVGISKIPNLGDYALSLLPTNGSLKLELKTTNGALLLTGNGQYTTKTGGEFRGTALAAPGYADQLAPFLQLMGPANNDGSVNLTLKLPSM